MIESLRRTRLPKTYDEEISELLDVRALSKTHAQGDFLSSG